MKMISGWILSLLVKLALSFLESKATSILKNDAPSVISRLTVVASNVKTFHAVEDFPQQVHKGGV